MGTSSDFDDFVLDQLRRLDAGRVERRRMFGGAGLYCEGVFFALLWRDRLYFKTAEAERAAYQTHGMTPFRPSARQTLSSYWEVPLEVLEDDETLVEWARRAVAAAHAAQAEKRRGTSEKRPRAQAAKAKRTAAGTPKAKRTAAGTETPKRAVRARRPAGSRR
jgi:DNA transformation protein